MKKCFLLLFFLFAFFNASSQNVSNTETVHYYSVEHLDGTEIIPLSRHYTSISPMDEGSKHYFLVSKRDRNGLCDLKGNEVVQPTYRYVGLHRLFDSSVMKYVNYYYIVIEDIDGKKYIADLKGKIIGYDISAKLLSKDSNGYYYERYITKSSLKKEYVKIDQSPISNYTTNRPVNLVTHTGEIRKDSPLYLESKGPFKINGLYYNVKGFMKASVAYTNNNKEEIKGDVVIPEHVNINGVTYIVDEIEAYAFANCQINSINIPVTIQTIKREAFNDFKCDKVYIESLDSWCKIDFETHSNPILYVDHVYINNVETENLVIPDNVTIIKPNSFIGWKNLKSVIIPKSVTEIGSKAFVSCKKLESIFFPNSVTKIDEYAFYNCQRLKHIEIPYSVKNIGKYAFAYCDILDCKFNNPTTIYGERVFYSCMPLKEILIPKGSKKHYKDILKDLGVVLNKPKLHEYK